MPLIASSMNVMEMNKAMISSVDLPGDDMPHVRWDEELLGEASLSLGVAPHLLLP